LSVLLIYLLVYFGLLLVVVISCFCFTDTATTDIYTLSLHDALPIFKGNNGTWKFIPTKNPSILMAGNYEGLSFFEKQNGKWTFRDRKSTRLNSSHVKISYAVFCLKKKNKKFRYKEISVTQEEITHNE